MKNVNFSPTARHRAGNYRWGKKFVLAGMLLLLCLGGAALWYDYRYLPYHRYDHAVRMMAEKFENLRKKAEGIQKGGIPSSEDQTVNNDQPVTEKKDQPERSDQTDSPVSPAEETLAVENVPLETPAAVPESPSRQAVSPQAVEENSPEKITIQVDKETEEQFAGYFVKVYSSIMKNEAEKAAARLARMNYLPRIVREPGFEVMKNVYLVTDSSNIQEISDRLTRDGFSVYLQEDQKNQYTIRVGSCYYLESAKSLLKSLKHKGYSGNIVQEKTAVKFYSVFVGRYSRFEAAQEDQRQLSMKGFPMATVTAGIPASDDQ
ncbi:MAG: SPOR domain-containing protein [bacterium]